MEEDPRDGGIGLKVLKVTHEFYGMCERGGDG